MDVKALYPNIRVDNTSEAVRVLLEESDVEYKNIDYTELARYLPLVVGEDKITEAQLDDVVMTRKTHLGRKPKVTGTEMHKEWDKDNTIWNAPTREPDNIEKRKMLALAVAEEVRFTMKHHMFKFRDGLYQQEEGGSIGGELTGVVAKTRVILYLRKLNSKLNQLGIKALLVKAFVDDVFLALKKVRKGMKYDDFGQCLVWNQEKFDEDANIPDDVVTAKLVVEIANTIEDNITLTFDTPSLNVDGRMPVLDMKLWCQENSVQHVFYEKEMTSSKTIDRQSALPWTTKKISLAGEVTRRMLNTSPQLVKNGAAEEYIEKFEYKMFLSGYSEGERSQIVKEGRARYFNILEKVEKGERPLYRPAGWFRKERALGKVRSEKNWYGVTKDTVVFVQATPGEILKKEVQAVVKAHGMKVRVVESVGKSLKRSLQRSDVEPGQSCGLPCVICESGGKQCHLE